MTDTEFKGLIRAVGRKRIRETVASLMAGNDAACFTTDQYAQAYARMHWGQDHAAGLRLFRSEYQPGGEVFAHWHLRTLFPGHAERGGWSTPTHVEAALTRVGVPWCKDRHATDLPVRGLAFLQITGPWDRPGVPVGAAYRKTHWVATNLVSDGTDSGEPDESVYDCNAGQEDGTRGDWWPRLYWERDVMAAVVAAHKRATGWRVRVSYEVTLP